MLVITPQERDALQMLADGTPAAAIAERLGVSAGDAEAAVNALVAALGSSSRSEALAVAVRRGLVSPTAVSRPPHQPGARTEAPLRSAVPEMSG